MISRSKQSNWFGCWFLLVFAAGFWGCSEDTSDGPAPLYYVGGYGGLTGTAGAVGIAGQMGVTGGATAGAGTPTAASGAGGRGNGGSATGRGGASGKTGAGGKTAAGGTTAGASGTASSGETGRMIGMTAAHNVVRAEVDTQTPLPDLTWSSTLAAYAQQWTDNLAKTCDRTKIGHRTQAELQQKGYGENLAVYTGNFGAAGTAQKAVDGWASEKQCWVYGKFNPYDDSQCPATCYQKLYSDGCGHYTAIVWRSTKQVGCGVSTCTEASTGYTMDIWVCNYSPGGNYVGQNPY